MKRIVLFSICLLAFGLTSQAQVLFTYAGKQVLAEEFIGSYQKNNIGLSADNVQAPAQYFETFLHNKLAIAEAYAQKVDQKEDIKNDLSNFSAQLANRYMVDSVTVKRLTEEAFLRSQKALHVFHIFISFQNTTGVFDLVEDLGLVTVFSLPYEMESAIYKLKPGQLSTPVISKAGFHFFKLVESINAPGYLQLQQILLAYPSVRDSSFQFRQRALADSLYNLLLNGSSFDSLATQFSNDNSSSLNNGFIQEIGVGSFDPLFEKQAWALTKNGMLSPPFETSFGIHILKRVSHRPIVTDKNNIDNNAFLLTKLMADSRWKASTTIMLAQVKKAIGASALKMTETELLNYYKEHLEQFSPAYKKQFQEIKEGILYFDIMQTEVWSKMANVVEPGSQLAAESKWFETLAKKYPVVVNEKVKKTTLAKLQKN